jgi:hypothetical protein
MHGLILNGPGLGGDASYLSAQVGASWFYPIADRWILNVLGETGVISGLSEDVEINERYFLGGATLRGFERAGIGPRDPATDDSLGGNYFYRGTVEMSFPIGFPEEIRVFWGTALPISARCGIWMKPIRQFWMKAPSVGPLVWVFRGVPRWGRSAPMFQFRMQKRITTARKFSASALVHVSKIRFLHSRLLL